jgi:hypothetical protein
MKSTLNLLTASYHSVQNIFSSLVVVFGCDTCSVMYREERKLGVFENRVLVKMCGSKREDVTGGWRKLDTEELDAFYPSPDVCN